MTSLWRASGWPRPAEILEDGKYGQPVPVEDATAQTQALLRSLNGTFRVAPEMLKARARGFYRGEGGKGVYGHPTWQNIVFQIMILSALSVGDIRQYDLLPLAFSKSLSEKLYNPHHLYISRLTRCVNYFQYLQQRPWLPMLDT